MSEEILRLAPQVTQDELDFRANADKFIAGQTEPADFKHYCATMGIYEQRKKGTYMIRVRIGAGLVTDAQLIKMAELAEKYADGFVHTTTRQDLQIHGAPAENLADILEQLLEVGLSTRGGGGNTVRNVTACPRTGVCPSEVFDVAPYSIAMAEYLLQDSASFTLPRKFKFVFSACPNDCSLASIADVGFFAKIKDGQKGFAVYAAGGLGRKPAIAIKIEDFITENEIFTVAEAMKRLFSEHGDRTNRNKARLRYVAERLGNDDFIKLYNEYKQQVQQGGLCGDRPEFRDVRSNAFEPVETTISEQLKDCSNILADKTAGRFSICIKLHNGDITSDNLIKLANIATQYTYGIVRTSQSQGLMLCGVSGSDVEKVVDALLPLGIDILGDIKPKIVACTGVTTCRLGICISRGLADAINAKLKTTDINANIPHIPVRISGCPNSCGQQQIAQIGLQGRARKINGRQMPFYEVLAGSSTGEGKTVLGTKVGSVPAKRVPDMIAELLEKGITDQAKVAEIAVKYAELGGDVPDDYYLDFGCSG